MIYSMADMMALWGWKKKSRRWRRRVLVSMIAHNAKERTTRAYKHRQPRTFGRNRGHALNEMSTLSPIEFLRMFRVDRDTFDHPEQMVAPLVERNVQQARNACGNGLSGEITVRTRLAVTLRWLTGAVYVDICFAWGVSHSVFFSERGVLWPTIEALDSVLPLGFPVNDAFAIEE
jgi:hypothetical protein